MVGWWGCDHRLLLTVKDKRIVSGMGLLRTQWGEYVVLAIAVVVLIAALVVLVVGDMLQVNPFYPP
jgi:hypothetical protein